VGTSRVAVNSSRAPGYSALFIRVFATDSVTTITAARDSGYRARLTLFFSGKKAGIVAPTYCIVVRLWMRIVAGRSVPIRGCAVSDLVESAASVNQ
jgi:hypothetical protein